MAGWPGQLPSRIGRAATAVCLLNEASVRYAIRQSHHGQIARAIDETAAISPGRATAQPHHKQISGDTSRNTVVISRPTTYISMHHVHLHALLCDTSVSSARFTPSVVTLSTLHP